MRTASLALVALLSGPLLLVTPACGQDATSAGDADGGTSGDGPVRSPVDAGGGYVIAPDGALTFRLDVQRVRVGGGADFSCGLLDRGAVKCWGRNDRGQLGLGDTQNRGDQPNEMGTNLPAVDLGSGRSAVSIAVGWYHACALLDDGTVKCWGQNDVGQLGQGDTKYRADGAGEMGDKLPAIALAKGRRAVAIAAGGYHSCALLEDGRLQCWGANVYAQLGLGDTNPRGDQPGEMGDALPFVDLGARVVAVAAGNLHTCAVLEGGALKCWGNGADGQTGLGMSGRRGGAPGEMGGALPAVDLGGGAKMTAVASGGFHTCALLATGAVKCWGHNDVGQQGQGDTTKRGDGPGEMGDALPFVNLGKGRRATSISTLYDHTCAVLDNGAVKCWGWNNAGQLGLGDKRTRGARPGEMADALPVVDLGSGRRAAQLGVGWDHTCAFLEGGAFKCWGLNWAGHLGLGDKDARGDDPGEMGDALPVTKL